MSLRDYMAVLFKAFQQRQLLGRRSQHGPGTVNRMRGKPHYTGEQLRAIRAENGVGRPLGKGHHVPQFDEPGGLTVAGLIEARDLGREPQYGSGPAVNILFPVQCRNAVAQHGSQRKAAAALGITLGKLQRELRKAA